MLNIVLFGPPGSGKGTQSEKIIEKYKLCHLSTGDILRGEIANKTELGIQANIIMSRGELVSDEIVIGMIKNKLEANKDAKGYIFDGFPRTVAQAEALDVVLNALNQEISCFISLEVEKDELIKRLVKRGEECGRTDDNLEVIENRIAVYHKQTAVVAKYYEKQGKSHPVEGMGSIEEIFERITAVIDK
ncbi:MAG: adenylate kinase [Bacteroidales bacterium]|nr:adenylate kinase [Bacteroidales bacterium]MCF8390221.1 adenylate kinase [Bacteroidales bacterium]